MSIRHLIYAGLFFFLGLFPSPTHSWTATVSVDTTHSQTHYPAGGIYPILFNLHISDSLYIHGAEEKKNGLIPTLLSFPDSSGISFKSFKFPRTEKKNFIYTKEPVHVYSGKIIVRGDFIVSKETPPGKHEITGKLAYQACSANACFPPEDVPVTLSLFIVPPGANASPLNQEAFDSWDTRPDFKGSETGFWLTLVAIFFGGLALNLTPCVYPLIPITVSYFGGRSEKVKEKTIIHGILYIAGLASTNSIMGLTASLSGGMLGSALQNPIVLLLVAGIMVSLGLSFFGLWEFRIPAGLTRLASKNFGGYTGTFFMGLTLGIVAAPCLGPFILGLLTLVGQKGDPVIGFLYFFVLSLGMGLPLSLLAIFSGALKKLPLSGEWMVWIRKLLGWVLVAMAGYMLQPLINNALVKAGVFAAMLSAAGIHLGWIESRRSASGIFLYMKKGLGVVLIVASGIILLTAFPEKAGIDWIAYDESVVKEAFRWKQPVIIDCYADWCIPCRALEKKVFRDPEVMNLSRNFVTVRIDLTREHTHQKKLRKRFQIIGVPTIIFINPSGEEEKALRIESFVNENEVIERMNRLLEPKQ